MSNEGALTSADFDQMPTLGDIARFHARERPDAIALSFEGGIPPFVLLIVLRTKLQMP